MIGLFVIGLFILWCWFALWLGRILANYLISLFTLQKLASSPFLQSSVGWLGRVLLTFFVFSLPFIDQLIAYPKWQQLCSTTGDFEWGPGMDEKKALGRELILFATTHETTIFPNIHVTYLSKQFKDAQTGELILNMPHAAYSASGMFYLPSSSGSRSAIFLNKCRTKYKSQKVMDYLNQFNLKVVEDRS